MPSFFLQLFAAQRTGSVADTVLWDDAEGVFLLEQILCLDASAWEPVTDAPSLQGALRTLEVPVTGRSRFFRLRRRTDALTTLVETSPAMGEGAFAITRQTVFRLSSPLALPIRRLNLQLLSFTPMSCLSL